MTTFPALGLALTASLAAAGEEGMLRVLPLDERSPAAGAALFETVPADASGIDFRHRFEPRSEEQVSEGSSVHAGGGVAIGDIDGDGRPEVCLTRPTGGMRLYRNLGGFRFEDASAAAGVGDEPWPLGPSLADVDGDGALDLHVGQRGAPSRLYRNRGDGTFEERAAAVGLAAEDGLMMSFADVDLDGDLDGYLLTYGRARTAEEETLVRPDGTTQAVPAGLPDRLYANERTEDGAQVFVDVSAPAGIAGREWGLSAVFFDPDDDGDPDLYVANDFFGADHLYVNRGDGTFVDRAPDALPHTPWFSMGAAAGDVDGDGRCDLIATDMAATTHAGEKVQMGDMSRNAWFLEAPTPRQVMRNALYVNTGTPRFQEAAFLAGVARSDWTWTPKLADLDLDGRLDLFIANGHTGDWFHGDLPALLTTALISGRAVDLPAKRDENLAFRNAGDLRFEPAGRAWGLARTAVSFGAAAGDLDGDGDLDLVVNDYEAPVALHRNGAAGARAVVRLSCGASGAGGAGARGRGARVRLVAEGRAQVRWIHPESGCMSMDEPVAAFGLGDAERIDVLEVVWPDGARQRFEDLPVDRRFEVAAPAATPPDAGPGVEGAGASDAPLFTALPPGAEAPVGRERAFDEFAAQPLLPFRLSHLGPGLAVCDVDGDGRDERYRSAPAGAAGAVERRGDDGRWTRGSEEAFAAAAESEDAAPLFLDADGDGDLDLFVASGGVEHPAGDAAYRDRLYLNDGGGAFAAAGGAALPDLRRSSSAVVALDVEGDGDLDLLVGARVVPGRYPAAGESVLLENRSEGGAARFADATATLAPGLAAAGMVTGATAVDVDDDGDPDVALAEEWGPVRLLGNEDGVLTDRGDACGGGARGLWSGVASGDLDHDGDLDLVATNLGWNTKYGHASHDPLRLYFGDLDGSGAWRVVEAVRHGEALLPIRGKSCSTRAFPGLAPRYPTFESFAHATLEEIYGADRLAAAGRLEVDTLAHAALENDGAGRFSRRPLPRVAQIAPAFGVAVTEVDGDGHPDLVLAQNHSHPQPETGVMSGGVGQVLLGDGALGFTPLRPVDSGVVVVGDGRGLVVADGDDDGAPELSFARNDRPGVTLEAAGPAGAWLVVVLPSARGVGARVTLERSDGLRQTAERSAGGGYWSQSPPRLFFGLGDAVPTRVTVRWRDGRTTTVECDEDQRRVEVDG